MSQSPGIMWAGSFDEKLHKLITIFASIDLKIGTEMGIPESMVKRAFLDSNTMETFCKAVISATDAVLCEESDGKIAFFPTSILTEAENEQMFSMVHSPFYGALVAIANLVKEYSKARADVDRDALIIRPLKKYWSQMIRHLWDLPARSLGAHSIFAEERSLVPVIFDNVVEIERSFASVIEDDMDLTVSLISRNWVHATGEAEIGYSFIFFLMIIPRLGISNPSSRSQPLFIVTSADNDPTLPILRRILQSDEFISEFVQATAIHLRRFRGFEAATVTHIIDRFWGWALAHPHDPLCARFAKEMRTSVPFWSNLFEASSKSLSSEPFKNTLLCNMADATNQLVCIRDSPENAVAVTKLLVSTCILDALESSLEEAFRCGTEEDQIELSRRLLHIYTALSYGIDEDPWYSSLIRRQLPRPRSSRRPWDISLKLTRGGAKRVAPSHAARMTLFALEQLYLLPGTCGCRGCEISLNARCSRCGLGYCGQDCQKRDWKDHKMICGVTMDMTLEEKDEAYSLVAGPDGLAKVKAEMGRD